MFVFILNFMFISNAFVSFPSILNHPFCDPPSIPCMSQFPIFFFFIIKKIIAHCHISVAHVIMAVVQWIMGSLPRATTTIKKNDFPFPTTINYSDTSAFFWRPGKPLLHWDWNVKGPGLVWKVQLLWGHGYSGPAMSRTHCLTIFLYRTFHISNTLSFTAN